MMRMLKRTICSCCAIIFLYLCFYFHQNSFVSQKKQTYLLKVLSRKLIPKQSKTEHIFWTKFSPNIGYNESHKKIRSDTFMDIENEQDKDHVNGNDEQEGSNSIKFNIDVHMSDLIPLNREIPDSRPQGCNEEIYPEQLPSTSIVIPFHNEWPSILVRTVHSLISRTPKHLLKKIFLVDDASDLKSLKGQLGNYVKERFPENLVKIIRLPSRQGLIRARLEGFKHVTSETVSFFDSHMEVNKDWLQPLLYEVMKDPKTIAMTQLDYIDKTSFKYNFYENYRTRYGFRWDMEFFETFFRPDQKYNKLDIDPLPGILMVGPGFVVNTKRFKEIGTYDDAMKIWGGENLELAWRNWLCGGRMLHVPCSHVGHIERSQPYSFPEGRKETELFNYRRAIEVWMGPYRKYVYAALPEIKNIDPGNLTERLEIRARLKCKDFSWLLENIWPELLPYQDVGKLWGQIKMLHGKNCLDNDNYLFQQGVPLKLKPCISDIQKQGFALTDEGQLRTTLHCVVLHPDGTDFVPYIENCFLNDNAFWSYQENQVLYHKQSQQCLQVMTHGSLVMQPCQPHLDSQKWIFINQAGQG